MSCDAFLPQVAAKAVGTLDEPGPLDAHLQGCQACAGLLEEMEGELDRARLPEEEPAPGGWDRVLLRLDGRTETAPPPVVRLHCSYCKDDLRRAEAAHCAGCLAPHHPDCFEEHGRCAAPGCGETRTLAAGRPAPAATRRGWRGGVVLALGLVAGGAGAVAAWNVRDKQAAWEWELSRANREREVAERQEAQRERTASLEPEPTFDGKPLSHWIEVLGDHGDAYRETGTRAVKSIGVQAIPALRAALGGDNPIRRAGAARALGRIGRPPQGEPGLGAALIALLRDPDSRVREAAAAVLPACLREEERATAVRALAALLERPELPELAERVAIHEALASFGDRPEARAAAARGLEREPVDEERLRIHRRLIREQPVPPEAVELYLQGMVKDPSPEVRQGLASGIDELPLGPELAKRAAACLGELVHQDPDEQVRRRALDRLVSLEPPAARAAGVPGMVAAITEARDLPGFQEHRARVYSALCNLEPASLRDPSALLVGGSLSGSSFDLDQPTAVVKGILTDLARRPLDLQRRGLRYLDQYTRTTPSLDLVPPLVVLAKEGGDPGVRLSAARWALTIGHAPELKGELRSELAPRLVVDVIGVLEGGSSPDTALQVAERLGPGAVDTFPALHRVATTSTRLEARTRALAALASVAPAESRTLHAILDAVESERKELIQAGASALRRLEVPATAHPEVAARVLPRLFARPASADDGPWLRQELLRALLRIGPPLSPEQRLQLDQLATDDPSDECRELARQYLAKLREAERGR